MIFDLAHYFDAVKDTNLIKQPEKRIFRNSDNLLVFHKCKNMKMSYNIKHLNQIQKYIAERNGEIE